MKKINVLVSGVGTIIGYGIINSLRQSHFDVNIFGMDMNPEAVGRYWCDDFIIAEPAASPSFVPFLKKVIDNNCIDIVLLGIEQDMNKINISRDELGPYLKKIAVNSKEVIDLTNDKWSTYNFLKNNGFPYIESTLVDDYSTLMEMFHGSFLVKPRQSYSSRGVKRIEDEITFDYYKYLLGKNFMAQRYIGDEEHEYTAAAFGFGDGRCCEPIVLKRKLSFEGSTLKAEVVDSPVIKQSIKTLSSILRPIGPTNFQYRVENDTAYLLEINPRISSSTSIRMAFGYNEAELAIQYYVHGEKDLNPVVTHGKAVRYISDYVVLS